MEIDKNLFKAFITSLHRFPMYIGESPNGLKRNDILNLLNMAATSVAVKKQYKAPFGQNIGIDEDGVPFNADDEERKLILEEKNQLLAPIISILES